MINLAARVETQAARISAIVARQRAAHRVAGPASAQQRIDRIDRAIALLVNYQQSIIDALAADFGHRSADFSRATDVLSPLRMLKDARVNLGEWMKPQPCQAARGEAWIAYQPLGVIGNIGPWNFPVHTAFGPLAGMLAAGNRVMIKPSEFTPATAELIERMVRSAFDESEIAVVTGDQEVGEIFSRQRFDHLLFTGSTAVGRQVMRAAAENLVPVTLELGGKSPTIVARSADLSVAARKIMAGKLSNAGQICLAPDYVFVPEERLSDFVDAARQAVAAMYPTLRDNPDYTAIINERHFARLTEYLHDAREQGATIVELTPQESFDRAASRRMAPALILEPGDAMLIMQNEIFGPLLPVKTYRTIDAAVAYIEDRPRPLGLYYFGNEPDEEARVLARTCSGGVTINDVIRHAGVDDLPFGGVGASGMGAYHGRHGFLTFSHARAIYRSAAQDVDLLSPPYTQKGRQIVASLITR